MKPVVALAALVLSLAPAALAGQETVLERLEEHTGAHEFYALASSEKICEILATQMTYDVRDQPVRFICGEPPAARARAPEIGAGARDTVPPDSTEAAALLVAVDAAGKSHHFATTTEIEKCQLIRKVMNDSARRHRKGLTFMCQAP